MKTVLIGLGALILLAGCGPRVAPHPAADVQELPQHAGAYLDEAALFLEPERQREYALDFDTRRFSPWYEPYSPDANRLVWPWGVYTPARGYGAHKKPLPPEWFEKLAANAQPERYPSMSDRAITLRRVNLRNFPTPEPYFRDFKKAGEGFPFDYLQNSTLHAMTPVRITHASVYGDWLFIESDHAHGWVRPNAVAALDNATIKELMNAQVVAITQEDSRVYGLDGRFLYEADVGALLFAAGQDASGWRLQSIVSNTLGEGILEPSWLMGEAKRWPLKADKQTLASLIDETIGQTYGWGGLYGNRDCSALMRDLFTPFGRWLPRNSFQQARSGEVIALAHLSQSEKLDIIQTEGRPFVSLIHFPGHIGLYLGTHEGEPVILHSTWGHKTRKGADEGRLIIGRSVITTLKAGSGLHPDQPSGLIDRATRLIHLDKGAYHDE